MRILAIVLLSTLLNFGCAKSPGVEPNPLDTIDEVELIEATEFPNAAGEAVTAEPGWYRVESAGDGAMRLVPAAGGDPLVVVAESRPHEQEVETDVAVAAREDEVLHIVLLRPGGAGLEANGRSAGEITERGSVRRRYTPYTRSSYRRLATRRLSARVRQKRIPTTPRSFAADLVQLTPQGNVVRQGRALIHPRYVRFDSSGVRQGRGTIVIVRRDQKVVWILDPSKKEYVEYPFDEAMIKNRIRQQGGTETARTVRQTSVAGYPTVEQTLDQQLTIQGSTKRRTLTAWTSSQLGASLAIREKDGSKAEFRGIRTQGFSSSEFALPSGYRRRDVITEEPADPPQRVDDCHIPGSDAVQSSRYDPMEPCKVGFTPSSGGTPMTKEQCKQRCKGSLAGDMWWATLTGIGWNPIGWIISGIRYDDCMRACDRIGRESTGGGGGGSILKPPTRLK